MELLTLYARLEPALEKQGYFDAAIYKDPERTQLYVRIQWWHETRRAIARRKRITLNCYHWNLEWTLKQ